MSFDHRKAKRAKRQEHRARRKTRSARHRLRHPEQAKKK
jgi:hypothetical protein